MSTLELERLIALANLCLCPVYFFSLLSIISVILGDFLISKYHLDTNYPKLVIFINIRQKFRKYYLYSNIS